MIDVAIVGAGPYGLSVASHVRSLDGLTNVAFGRPMEFWDRRMPRGMRLRSPWAGSHLADPAGALTLDAYARACGSAVPRPIPLETFVDYGRWFQRHAVPDLDTRTVTRIEKRDGVFHLEIEGKDGVEARAVVVAVGVGPFAHRPDQFRELSRQTVSHASEHASLDGFAGRSVLVVGAGQSALETAALLAEAGARVEVLCRGGAVRFLVRSSVLHRLGPFSRLLYSPAEVGPAVLSLLAAAPSLFRRLPGPLRETWCARCIRPAGAAWLVDRLRTVTLTTGVSVVTAVEKGRRVTVLLNDGTERVVDHVMLCTGYRVDVERYDFLAPEIREAVVRVQGKPCLSAGFESSVPGLYFAGASSAWTFGPLMHFVAGARFAAERICRDLRRRLAS